METCLYNGKQICAYSIVNNNLALNYELKKEWKIASKNGELFCEECGKEVTLRIRDPQKRVPHFSHKVTDEKCPYNNNPTRESEEHKKGKMVLYNYFKDKYKDIDINLNHRFPNKRRTDLLIEFNSGEKLAIEYQRTELDILDWQERQKEYEKLSVGILWLLSGKEEILQIKEQQIEVSFFQQIMLNELDKIAVYLDVDKTRIIFAKNMQYSDPYVVNNDFQELYIKSYNLTDVLIHPNGKIGCNFAEEYIKANEEFINNYAAQCLYEEQQRELAEEDKKRRQAEDFQRRLMEKRFSINDEDIIFEDKHEDKQVRYFTRFAPYKNIIKYALKGSLSDLQEIAKYLREDGISDDFSAITTIFKYNYLIGNSNAPVIYKKVIEIAEFGTGDLEIKERNIDELKCPICNGKLQQKYGKFGWFVSCSNFPLCRLSFNIDK
ncbi:MAG: competence protein CoiA family protein [Bacillota bacterium]|nr:competence protein CoiA family protein [Bacillota bacterium]